MSDGTQGDIDGATDYDVTVAEYRNYSAAKGIRHDCPMCGSTSWLVDIERDDRSYTWFCLKRKSANIIKSPIAFVLNVYCDNCGFVASFNRKKIEEWRENKT